MDIKAIEAYGQIVAIECEGVWLVGVGCHLDFVLHLGECAYQGNVVWGEIEFPRICHCEEFA